MDDFVEGEAKSGFELPFFGRLGDPHIRVEHAEDARVAPASIDHDPLRVADDAETYFAILFGGRMSRNHHIVGRDVLARGEIRQHRAVRIKEEWIGGWSALDVGNERGDGLDP